MLLIGATDMARSGQQDFASALSSAIEDTLTANAERNISHIYAIHQAKRQKNWFLFSAKARKITLAQSPVQQPCTRHPLASLPCG